MSEIKPKQAEDRIGDFLHAWYKEGQKLQAYTDNIIELGSGEVLSDTDLREVLYLLSVSKPKEKPGVTEYRFESGASNDELRTLDVLDQLVQRIPAEHRKRLLTYVWSKYGGSTS